jgi:tetratricopeptide (TPR) repeat protein
LVDQEPARAVEHLQEAIAADSLTAEPWKQLANLAFQAWQVQPRPETLQRFRQAADEALSREPKAASTWLYYAQRYFEIYERTGQREDLETALSMYQRAVELYPNSPLSRAKLAMAYRAAGRQTDFAREAAQALELDAITPHFDKKLPDTLRDSLKTLTTSSQQNQ